MSLACSTTRTSGPWTVQALEADVRAWIDQWNSSPRPFVWKETAEEILDSLAQRISGGEH